MPVPSRESSTSHEVNSLTVTGQTSFNDVLTTQIGPERERTPVSNALALSDPFFEIYRAEKVRVTSTLFRGGDWHWQFSVAAGVVVASGGGFASEGDCRAAVTALRRSAQSAKIFSRLEKVV